MNQNKDLPENQNSGVDSVKSKISLGTTTINNMVVEILQLKPDPKFVEYEKTEDMDILSGDEIGNYGYRIYDQNKNVIHEDLCCMGDEGACFENAKNEIRFLLEEVSDESN